MDEDLSRCEIIVIDNASDEKTKQIITRLKEQGKIDKLFFSTKNTLFAGGNNIGATLASIDSKYYLLMNSDLQIRKKTWLRDLLFFKKKYKASIASYGHCDNPSRSDGFCAIVDKEIYDRYKLDENFAWWYSFTKLQAKTLSEGKNILAFNHHSQIVFHYGGRSGKDFINAKGMDVDFDEVLKWFKNIKGRVYKKNGLLLLLPNILKQHI